MSASVSRRTFLLGSLAAPVVATAVSQRARAADKLRIGIIGVGGQGAYTWNSLANEEIVMLCDVDTARAAPAAQRFPKAEVVQDFRRVLDRKDIDAVAVCTPDHWHAIPTVWAMESGKHVYCEKPLGHTVYETRVMAETAAKYKRVTQMGTQIHAGANYRRVVELVQSGAIGTVRRVDVWCEKQPSAGKRSSTGAVPATLDYDLWLGPSPSRPYDPNIVPFNWRWWWEFGGGVLGDMGCHYMDLAHWALGLRHPDRVSATGTPLENADNTVPQTLIANLRYPETSARPAVHLTWYHGIAGPKGADGSVRKLGLSNGVLFRGDKGDLLADYSSHKLLPEEQFKDFQRPSPTIPNSVGHHQEWVDAIKNGGTTTCNFDYSGALTESVLLGNVAYRLGREIMWDAEKLRVTNVPKSEWEQLIQREYRNEWTLRRPK